MGILKEAINDVKIFILKGLKKGYVKAIVICVIVVICFSSGLFTGCGNYGSIKAELSKIATYNRKLEESNRILEDNNRRLEQTAANLRIDLDSFTDRYTELSNTYNGIRSAYIKLQEGVIKSDLANSEASRIIKESIKLIEKEND